jgi:SRSO17 transposase
MLVSKFRPMSKNTAPGEAATSATEKSPAEPLRGEARAVPLATDAMPRELATYMGQWRRVFGRLETYENACSYVLGLLSDLPRKNGEKMTEAIEGIANTEAVHRLLALSSWSAEDVDRLRVRHAVAHGTSREQDGALILDEVGQLKQGRCSVGVKRQYLGSEGKTANGQVTVTAHYCDGRFDWPVTGRLYLPQEWAEDTPRRTRAGVPEEITFATKPEIALALVRRALEWGVPFRWVLTDSGYEDLDFLGALATLGLWFCIGVKRDFMVRVPEEIARWVPPPPARRGRPRKHVDPRSLPSVYRVDELLAGLPDSLWRPVTYRQGTAGLLTKEFVALRVQAATTKRIGPDVWLLFERSLPGHGNEIKHYVLSAERELCLDEMAQVAHRRPVIERFSYENGKSELGLRDYQGRSWRGFHHHLALVMVALTWLNFQRQPLPSKEPPSPPPPTTARASVPASVEFSLPTRDQHPLRFSVAGLADVALPLPRHLWESVQEVRRRFVAWCAATVHLTLAQRGTPLRRPAFVPLCLT